MTPHEPRYRIHAYVGQGERVRWMADIGTWQSQEIYLMRPASYRYAILETVHSEFWIVDLARQPLIGQPKFKPYQTFPTIEAAVMAAVLTYGDE